MIIFLDTYAWIEYFIGSHQGKRVSLLLDNEDTEIFTAECSLGEIRGWCLRQKYDFVVAMSLVQSNSTILPISQKDWISSGEERHEQRKTQKDFGLIDALILTKAKEHNANILTGDEHFKKLKNVLFL